MSSGVQQLVVDVHDRSIQAVDNPADLDPETFDQPDKGVMIPRFGTQALLLLASRAVDYGYTLLHVGLLDRSMTPLSIDEEERVEDELVESLRSGDLANARRVMTGARGPLTPVSLELMSAHNEPVHVGWLGDLRVESCAPVRDLLIPAWNGLHLG
ncbi:hypothetical protein G3N18_14475 [Microbacterium sp. 2C]|uniref:hypothetical protein n=1 Tax=Microbacterium paulum TaxID=2707006 RepID=UPI0018C2A85E|nr:hypothetical protein [Microbacterium paulum]MBG0719245.1 hypothetical protein [Microbacterium paulum]